MYASLLYVNETNSFDVQRRECHSLPIREGVLPYPCRRDSVPLFFIKRSHTHYRCRGDIVFLPDDMTWHDMARHDTT